MRRVPSNSRSPNPRSQSAGEGGYDGMVARPPFDTHTEQSHGNRGHSFTTTSLAMNSEGYVRNRPSPSIATSSHLSALPPPVTVDTVEDVREVLSRWEQWTKEVQEQVTHRFDGVSASVFPMKPFSVANVSTASQDSKQLKPMSTRRSRALLYKRALDLEGKQLGRIGGSEPEYSGGSSPSSPISYPGETLMDSDQYERLSLQDVMSMPAAPGSSRGFPSGSQRHSSAPPTAKPPLHRNVPPLPVPPSIYGGGSNNGSVYSSGLPMYPGQRAGGGQPGASLSGSVNSASNDYNDGQHSGNASSLELANLRDHQELRKLKYASGSSDSVDHAVQSRRTTPLALRHPNARTGSAIREEIRRRRSASQTPTPLIHDDDAEHWPQPPPRISREIAYWESIFERAAVVPYATVEMKELDLDLLPPKSENYFDGQQTDTSAPPDEQILSGDDDGDNGNADQDRPSAIERLLDQNSDADGADDAVESIENEDEQEEEVEGEEEAATEEVAEEEIPVQTEDLDARAAPTLVSVGIQTSPQSTSPIPVLLAQGSMDEDTEDCAAEEEEDGTVFSDNVDGLVTSAHGSPATSAPPNQSPTSIAPPLDETNESDIYLLPEASPSPDQFVPDDAANTTLAPGDETLDTIPQTDLEETVNALEVEQAVEEMNEEVEAMNPMDVDVDGDAAAEGGDPYDSDADRAQEANLRDKDTVPRAEMEEYKATAEAYIAQLEERCEENTARLSTMEDELREVSDRAMAQLEELEVTRVSITELNDTLSFQREQLEWNAQEHQFAQERASLLHEALKRMHDTMEEEHGAFLNVVHEAHEEATYILETQFREEVRTISCDSKLQLAATIRAAKLSTAERIANSLLARFHERKEAHERQTRLYWFSRWVSFTVERMHQCDIAARKAKAEAAQMEHQQEVVSLRQNIRASTEENELMLKRLETMRSEQAALDARIQEETERGAELEKELEYADQEHREEMDIAHAENEDLLCRLREVQSELEESKSSVRDLKARVCAQEAVLTDMHTKFQNALADAAVKERVNAERMRELQVDALTSKSKECAMQQLAVKLERVILVARGKEEALAGSCEVMELEVGHLEERIRRHELQLDHSATMLAHAMAIRVASTFFRRWLYVCLSHQRKHLRNVMQTNKERRREVILWREYACLGNTPSLEKSASGGLRVPSPLSGSDNGSTPPMKSLTSFNELRGGTAPPFHVSKQTAREGSTAAQTFPGGATTTSRSGQLPSNGGFVMDAPETDVTIALKCMLARERAKSAALQQQCDSLRGALRESTESNADLLEELERTAKRAKGSLTRVDSPSSPIALLAAQGLKEEEEEEVEEKHQHSAGTETAREEKRVQQDVVPATNASASTPLEGYGDFQDPDRDHSHRP